MAELTLSEQVPIIAYMQSGGFFRWAKSLYNTISDYDFIAAIKLSPDAKYVAASAVGRNNDLPMTIIILNAINGNVYQSLVDQDSTHLTR